MTVANSLLLAVLASASQAQSPADSLRMLALRLTESALTVEARARPLDVREALAAAFARSVTAPVAEREQELVVARRLSSAYAIAWGDSFLVRQVARFDAAPPTRRAAKVWVDSARRAGITAFGRDGPTAAIVIWRRALVHARAHHDSAGIAALLGNIGAGFVEAGRADSAVIHLQSARRLAATVGDRRVEANAIDALAGLSFDRGDATPARELYARALALHERIGDTRGMAADRNNLGLLAQSAGDLEGARRHYETAFELNRRDGRDEHAATNLVNLAGLASLAGDFARAEALYRDALATWRAREMWADAAVALHGLGQLELRRGDYPAGIAALREGLEIYDRTGPVDDAITVRQELAGALAAVGALQDAVDELRGAERTADSVRAPAVVRAGISLARADLAVQLNALAEAERLYARAEESYREAREPAGIADARHGRGVILLARGDHAAAQAMLESALRAQMSAEDGRSAALTRLALAELSWERGDTLAARRQLARATSEVDRVGDPVVAAVTLGEHAALEARTGNPAAAESLYRTALHRLGDRVAPEIAWRLHQGLALAHRSQGAASAAVRGLRAALAELERPGASLVLPERRSAFLADKWDVYAQLALTEHARGRPGAAFEASERLRAREMLEMLGRGRIAAVQDTAEELVVREQDLRRRIAELTRDLESFAGDAEALRGPDVSLAGSKSREALLNAQEAYAGLLLEIRERAPRHANLVSAETATWQDVARRLATDQALIEYLVSDSGSLAFVVTRDTVAVLGLGIGRHDLARLVEFARGTIGPRGSVRADSLWRSPMRRLHEHLIDPIEQAGLLAGKTRLVFVPHAELHYLPVAALLESEQGGRFLIERYEIAMAPSASVWLALGLRRSARASAGVLALAPKSDALPASGREAAAIARLAGADTRVLVGAAATEEAFRRDAPTRRVLHLATYGVLNKHNPLFSFVELAPAGAHDGRLEVHEVFGLRLNADLVVLSACQTGLGSGALADVPAGDDWVGLTRAFLHAGARQVVATLWPVDDWATAALMERFYERLAAGDDPAAALAAAQRAMRAGSETARPFYWAGFVLVGGR